MWTSSITGLKERFPRDVTVFVTNSEFERENPPFASATVVLADDATQYGWESNEGFEILEESPSTTNGLAYTVFDKRPSESDVATLANRWSTLRPTPEVATYLVVKYPYKVVLSRYSQYIPPDPGAESRAMRNWGIFGSNNNSTWTTIHSVSDDTPVSGVNEYSDFTRPAAYQYFRLECTANQDATIDELMISELKLFTLSPGPWTFAGSQTAAVYPPVPSQYTEVAFKNAVSAQYWRVVLSGGDDADFTEVSEIVFHGDAPR